MARVGWLVAALALASTALAHEGAPAEIERLDAALSEAPGDAELLLRRARAWRRAGKPSRALSDLTRARRAAPEDRRWDLEEALALIEAGRARRAEARLSRFLEGGPHPVALWERGRLREAAGRSALALEDYDAAIAASERPSIDLYLARGRLQRAQGDLAAAAAGYREGLSTRDGAIVLRRHLIEIERQRGAWDAAIDALAPLIEASRNRAPALLERAELEALAGRIEIALATCIDALDAATQLVRRRPAPRHLKTHTDALAAVAASLARTAREPHTRSQTP